MEVYKFNKCLLDRLEESMLVLPWKDEIIAASQVKEQWSCYIELQIEPAGWQAVWNIPRVICEVLNLRYPTSVFGYVEQVLFKELRAVFVVEAVEDEGVNFLERHEVAFEELWPTISQENSALNVERTADCLDRLRFFYSHVWMPWDDDNDDDLNWVEKHLESRIRFCYDLRKGCINRKVAQHIRTLLTEAKYIQKRREFLELGLSDDEADGETTLESTQVTDLMRLHLRLSMIRNEIEILENPEMRRIYEQVHYFDNDGKDKNDGDILNNKIKRAKAEKQQKCFIITQTCTLARQIELLKKVETKIDSNCLVELSPVLLDALNKTKQHDMIFLAPGKHRLKFLEYLNEDGFMSGIFSDTTQSNALNMEDRAVISSLDDDSMLLIFNGDYTLENLVFDCKNVRTGISVKSGNIILQNCHLIGDGKSSTQQGIVCTRKTKLTLINCTIEKFANGVVMERGTELILKHSKIVDCNIGLDIIGQDTIFNVKNTRIINAGKCGIHVENLSAVNFKTKQMHLDSFKQLSELSSFTGDCEFEHCKSNIHIVNGHMTLVASASLTSIRDEIDIDDFQDCVETLSTQSTKEVLTEKNLSSNKLIANLRSYDPFLKDNIFNNANIKWFSVLIAK